VDDAYLERLEDRYVEAAERAAPSASISSTSSSATHLLNELLSARNRDGRYRGSLRTERGSFTNVDRKIAPRRRRSGRDEDQRLRRTGVQSRRERRRCAVRGRRGRFRGQEADQPHD
jgi:hypothetical protein